MSSNDELEKRSETDTIPPPIRDTEPAPDEDVEHLYFATHFAALGERIDKIDRVMSEVATAAKLSAEASARLVSLVDDSLRLSKAALDVQRTVSRLDFRLRLVELHLGLNPGEEPD